MSDQQESSSRQQQSTQEDTQEASTLLQERTAQEETQEETQRDEEEEDDDHADRTHDPDDEDNHQQDDDNDNPHDANDNDQQQHQMDTEAAQPQDQTSSTEVALHHHVSGGGGGRVKRVKEEQPYDPVADAISSLPKTFLHYDAPIVEDASVPSTILPLVIQEQAATLTETPVVTTTDRILDAILPPRVVEVEAPVSFNPKDAASSSLIMGTTIGSGNDDDDDNENKTKPIRIIQRVSHTQYPRQELGQLRRLVATKLKEAKSRDAGICPVRRAVMTMLFDEMLRQVAIDLPERGLMLLRIRDELNMTLDAYETLYRESSQYSAHKLHESTKHTPAMMERINQLTKDVKALKKEEARLDSKETALKRCVAEIESSQVNKNRAEKNFLKSTEERLKQHLEAVKAAQEAEKRAFKVMAEK